MPRRRTLEEKAEYMSAEEVAVAFGIHPRNLKRKIRAGAMTPPAKYTDEQRYLFTAEEVDRAREELGLGRPLALLERARGTATASGAFAHIGTSLPRLDMAATAMKQFEALGARIAFTEAAAGLDAQLRVQDDLSKWMSDIQNTPSGALQRSIARQARQLNEALRRIGQMPSTANWIKDVEERAQWIGQVEARGPVQPAVPPGQVAAFADDDADEVAAQATLDDVLSELRETNRLLRTLVEDRGTNPAHTAPGPTARRDDDPEGGSTYRE